MWDNWIAKKYAALATIRTRRAKLNHHVPRLFSMKGQSYLNFVSNDYLGLACHPKLIKTFINAAEVYGIGSTGAATTSGYTEIQDQLQHEIAQWLGFEASLVFNSGYQLNSTLYSQLADANTTIWLDKRCHASHIDGIRLAKQACQATIHLFHPDIIDSTLQKIITSPNKRHVVISEGIFSMDGSCTYLDKLIQLRNMQDNILLIIDDAHGIGAIGTNGYGSLATFINTGVNNVDLLIGTMGKTLGVHGGFICGKKNMINYLAQVVRGQLFTTCLPPAILATARESITIITSAEGQNLRNLLKLNITQFKQICTQLPLPLLFATDNTSPIQLLGFEIPKNQALFDNNLEVANNFIKTTATTLLQAGIYVGMMCYPTVSKHLPRLRISLNSAHTQHDIEALCTAININSKKVNL